MPSKRRACVVAQRLQIAIEHRQIGAHAESDPRRVCSGNATADDQDARRRPSVVADVFFGDVVVAGLQGLEDAENFLLLGEFHRFVVICSWPRW